MLQVSLLPSSNGILTAKRRQTAVTGYLKCEQLLLFAFALQSWSWLLVLFGAERCPRYNIITDHKPRHLDNRRSANLCIYLRTSKMYTVTHPRDCTPLIVFVNRHWRRGEAKWIPPPRQMDITCYSHVTTTLTRSAQWWDTRYVERLSGFHRHDKWTSHAILMSLRPWHDLPNDETLDTWRG